jgi:PAS domain S-box-containing protein
VGTKAKSTATERRRLRLRLRPGEIAGYLAAALALSLAAALAVRHLPLAGAAAAFAALLLLFAGAVLLRHVRTAKPMRVSYLTVQPTWHDQVPCYVAALDRDLRIVDVNERFRGDFGDRLGEHCYLAFKRSDAPCPNCAAQRTLRDGQVHTGDESVVRSDGKTMTVVETTAPFVNAAGDVTGVTLVATDVGESFKLRRELDQSRRDYERLFAAVPCFICVQDRDHRIIEANSLYRREFGADYGSRCWEVCKKRHSQCPNCTVDQTFADGRVHTSEEVLVTRDGRRINAVVHTRPVLDDDGSISAVMEVFTDITEVKVLERQLSLMGRAVAGMAHRIKNILMGLEGGIFVVNSGLENDDRQAIAEGWEMVERNVGRVSRIVKDLLYCSKDRPPSFIGGVSLQAIVREVCELYAERIAKDGTELRMELSPRDCVGSFDPEGIHNLLSNLIANAIDACRFDPSPGKDRHTITVRCHSNGDGSTVLEVEDDGIGIPDEMNSRVFEEFFSSKGSEGTGIGLLVVQKVAEEHRGKASFRSLPGRGTIFTITLPNSDAGGTSKPATA